MSIGSSPPGCDEPFCFVFRAFCKRQSSTHIREYTRHAVLDLLGPHVEVFFSAREHWWLSQTFLVNKHPSRRCLCTIQLHAVLQDLVQCSVVLATELRVQRSDSSKRSPAVAMLATHLPFLDVRLVNNLVTSRIARQSQGFPESHGSSLTSRHQGQTRTARGCFPRDFASRPPTSSTLAQRFATLSRDQMNKQDTRSATMIAGAVSCAQLCS